MNVRKKHVRWIVFGILLVAIPGPLIYLASYALWLRGGAYGAAIEEALASRLRCRAEAMDARPTGPGAMEAHEVRLTWDTGDGSLVLRLKDLKAAAHQDGWHVTADEGELVLDGAQPMTMLRTLNQRLVQTEKTQPLATLRVEEMSLRMKRNTHTPGIDPDRSFAGGVNGRLIAAADAQTGAVTVRMTPRPPELRAFVITSAAPGDKPVSGMRFFQEETVTATLRLRPTAATGVFDSLDATLKHLPLSAARRWMNSQARQDVHGGMDIAIHCPAGGVRVVRIHFEGVNPADWLPANYGGSLPHSHFLSGTMECRQAPGQPPSWKVSVANPEALPWRTSLPQILLGAPAAATAPTAANSGINTPK